ncbi:hypothetical protein BC828DRAFT_400646 [Blastocladiella britannica]|nr:hypothetical protein BC828DRAFT_400646 [Blastocladiella britannica]
MGKPLMLADPDCSRLGADRFAELAIPAELFLDYLWDFCTRIGVPFAPAHNSPNLLLMLETGDVEAAGWWYAMHHAHGTVFLTHGRIEGMVMKKFRKLLMQCLSQGKSDDTVIQWLQDVVYCGWRQYIRL